MPEPLPQQGAIHVCPLCHELADYSDDWGWTITCHHPPYKTVEPIEVQGEVVDGAWTFPLPDPEEWKRTTGAEMIAKQDEAKRKRAEWLALSCDERVAIREKQREANPTTFMMSEVMRDQLASPIFLHPQKTITVRCPKCKDAGCPNSYTRDNPNYRDMADFWSGGYTVKVETGTTKPSE